MHRKKSVPLKEIHKFGKEVKKEIHYEIRRLRHSLHHLRKKKPSLHVPLR